MPKRISESHKVLSDRLERLEKSSGHGDAIGRLARAVE